MHSISDLNSGNSTCSRCGWVLKEWSREGLPKGQDKMAEEWGDLPFRKESISLTGCVETGGKQKGVVEAPREGAATEAGGGAPGRRLQETGSVVVGHVLVGADSFCRAGKVLFGRLCLCWTGGGTYGAGGSIAGIEGRRS